MRPGGFEPPTNSLEGCCSIHLSYGRKSRRHNLTDPVTKEPWSVVPPCHTM
jgi:hypothetical protein